MQPKGSACQALWRSLADKTLLSQDRERQGWATKNRAGLQKKFSFFAIQSSIAIPSAQERRERAAALPTDPSPLCVLGQTDGSPIGSSCGQSTD